LHFRMTGIERVLGLQAADGRAQDKELLRDKRSFTFARPICICKKERANTFTPLLDPLLEVTRHSWAARRMIA